MSVVTFSVTKFPTGLLLLKLRREEGAQPPPPSLKKKKKHGYDTWLALDSAKWSCAKGADDWWTSNAAAFRGEDGVSKQQHGSYTANIPDRETKGITEAGRVQCIIHQMYLMLKKLRADKKQECKASHSKRKFEALNVYGFGHLVAVMGRARIVNAIYQLSDQLSKLEIDSAHQVINRKPMCPPSLKLGSLIACTISRTLQKVQKIYLETDWDIGLQDLVYPTSNLEKKEHDMVSLDNTIVNEEQAVGKLQTIVLDPFFDDIHVSSDVLSLRRQKKKTPVIHIELRCR